MLLILNKYTVNEQYEIDEFRRKEKNNKELYCVSVCSYCYLRVNLNKKKKKIRIMNLKLLKVKIDRTTSVDCKKQASFQNNQPILR